jgi:isovaleryl-CoA dehydrogenase
VSHGHRVVADSDTEQVPAANLLGSENGGVGIMMSGLDLERAWVSVGCTGTAERAIDLAVGWAQQRVQFGKPIGSFQLIQDKLARMYTAHASAQLLVYKALAACEAVEAGGAGRGEIHKVTTAAYMAATEAVKVCCVSLRDQTPRQCRLTRRAAPTLICA